MEYLLLFDYIALPFSHLLDAGGRGGPDLFTDPDSEDGFTDPDSEDKNELSFMLILKNNLPQITEDCLSTKCLPPFCRIK